MSREVMQIEAAVRLLAGQATAAILALEGLCHAHAGVYNTGSPEASSKAMELVEAALLDLDQTLGSAICECGLAEQG